MYILTKHESAIFSGDIIDYSIAVSTDIEKLKGYCKTEFVDYLLIDNTEKHYTLNEWCKVIGEDQYKHDSYCTITKIKSL